MTASLLRPDLFPWQERFRTHLLAGEFDKIAYCRIPTGLGKTAVIPLWLSALAEQPKNVPRRLVYVVNRRTVVDQASDEARAARCDPARPRPPKAFVIAVPGLLVRPQGRLVAAGREHAAGPIGRQPGVAHRSVAAGGNRRHGRHDRQSAVVSRLRLRLSFAAAARGLAWPGCAAGARRGPPGTGLSSTRRKDSTRADPGGGYSTAQSRDAYCHAAGRRSTSHARQG